MTWLILEPFAQLLPPARELLDAFLQAAGRRIAHAGLGAAAARRLRDPNVTSQERAVIEELVRAELAT